MIYSDFKKLVLSKMVNRDVIPPNSNIDNKVHTALKKVAKDTVPLKLVVQDPSTYSVLRKVDENTYIRLPNRPIQDADTIDIDEVLLDAVALYVCAGIEPSRAGAFMLMYREEIEFNNSRLIETTLSDGSNDGYYNDPSYRLA